MQMVKRRDSLGSSPRLWNGPGVAQFVPWPGLAQFVLQGGREVN
jgi:hypothetical protein